MVEESVFLNYVRHIFQKWEGFQRAIEDGMGGPDAKMKEDFMAVVIENYFKSYENVSPEDIDEYLGDMLDYEFDIVCDDANLNEVSTKLCTAYELSLTNPNHEIFREMKESKASSLQPKKVSKSEESEEEKVTPICSTTEEISGEINNLTMNEKEEGWTTVSSKHKKHK